METVRKALDEERGAGLAKDLKIGIELGLL